jgi:hypothetical protein
VPLEETQSALPTQTHTYTQLQPPTYGSCYVSGCVNMKIWKSSPEN